MTVNLCPSVQIPVRKEVSEILHFFFSPVVTLMILGAGERNIWKFLLEYPKFYCCKFLDY